MLEEKFMEMWLIVVSHVNEKRENDILTLNETKICNYLQLQNVQNPDEYLTASDLCKKTNMLKSQMNRTLSALEEKGMIRRMRAENDARKNYVVLNENNEIYQKQKEILLEGLHKFIDKYGKERIEDALEMVEDIADMIEAYEKRKGE